MSRRKDGRYVVGGRKKDMIKRAGENVYPAAVEDKIATFEKVAHCAVVGMPTGFWVRSSVPSSSRSKDKQLH